MCFIQYARYGLHCFNLVRREKPGPPGKWNVGGAPVGGEARKRAKPTPMMRLFGSARFSGTYNVPNWKWTVPVSGVVRVAGSIKTSPALPLTLGSLLIAVHLPRALGSPTYSIPPAILAVDSIVPV